VDSQIRLREAQAKYKTLVSSRDQVIAAKGAEERKLEETYEKLQELGIDAKELSSDQLQTILLTKEKELEDALVALEESLETGTRLLAEYQKVT
jgi:hypothetical protein